jgi:hypothetical protein
VALLWAVVVVSGCAMKRIENGVYHSSKGYRVTIPNAEWAPVDGSPADLELRRRGSPAGLAVNAVCDGTAPRRSAGVLARQLLIGLRDRRVIDRAEAEIAGRPAWRTTVEGRLEDSTTRMRIESLVTKDERCVYDFIHVAPPDVFAASGGDFARFVGSFRTD